MNCEQCKNLLVDYCRDTLPPAGLASHLQQCESCAQAYAALGHINLLLDVEEAPPARLRANFMARLDQATRQRPARFPARRIAALFHALWPSRPLGAFSYSTILLLCGMVSGQLLPVDVLGLDRDMTANGFDQDIPRERLIQLCAVPPTAPNGLL